METFLAFSLADWFSVGLLRLADILELRKLRKAREGIDVAKLNKGEVKKRRRSPEPAGGLVKVGHHDEEE